MYDFPQFFIDGAWIDPVSPKRGTVIDPATEAIAGYVTLGGSADVDRAVKAARRAFPPFSRTSQAERIALLRGILERYDARRADLAAAVRAEMGAPRWLAEGLQVAAGAMHLQSAIEVLQGYKFAEDRGTTRLVREPIGVCGLITPWNWPLSLIMGKVAPAIAVGCTIVLKPSELAPFSACVLAEIMDAARVPRGVFNLVNGEGSVVGAAISAHPDIDLVSFTGSTRAGVEVARSAAASVKRVHQELGGKSPNIILDDADMQSAISTGVRSVMTNSGQTCNAPTRMLVPKSSMEEAAAIAKLTAESIKVGDPAGDAWMGPVVSRGQWEKIQSLIRKGIDEGATLVTGGLGRPADNQKGFFVKPTIFANVTNHMTVAREEIFGPVLVILGYDDVEEAIALANDTVYGLSAYVSGKDLSRVRYVASQLRAGQVNLNSSPRDPMAPFGGFKQSGNGREWGEHGFLEFLEVKAMIGHGAGPHVGAA
jgi:aldehyde dehydrogenase (NAD+)